MPHYNLRNQMGQDAQRRVEVTHQWDASLAEVNI